MKLLHTSDWHVGKAVRGHSREPEHQAVLDEITTIARDNDVDLVVVAGDLFDSAAPTAASERLVYNTLLGLAEVSPVVVIAGNHDNPRRLDAVARLLALGRVTVAVEPRRPADGGVVELVTEDGTAVRMALVPFVSQRAIVRADALMDEPAFRNAQTYAAKLQAVLGALSSGFTAESVNLVVAHLFVAGATTGGGERAAHLVEEYAVSAIDIPATVSYAALGHLHRPQAIAGKTAIHYCGSPLQLDFGEELQTKQVNLVRAEPGLPAKVEPVPLRSGRQMVTLTGTLDQLTAAAAEVGDAWLRVRLRECPRAGLADEVRAVLGDAVVDVRVELPDVAREQRRSRRDGRSPSRLFADYLAEQDTDDARLRRAFDAMHDDLCTPAPDLPAPEPHLNPAPEPAVSDGPAPELHLDRAPEPAGPETHLDPADDAEQLSIEL